LPKAGADVIELGMPFTDPMAEGPAIQQSYLRALSGGQTMAKTLALARAFREGDTTTPLVLMAARIFYRYCEAPCVAIAQRVGHAAQSPRAVDDPPVSLALENIAESAGSFLVSGTRQFKTADDGM